MSSKKGLQFIKGDDVCSQFRGIICNVTTRQIMEATGLCKTTIDKWRGYGATPSLTMADKVLQGLGYELKIIKKENENNEIEM